MSGMFFTRRTSLVEAMDPNGAVSSQQSMRRVQYASVAAVQCIFPRNMAARTWSTDKKSLFWPRYDIAS